MFYYKSKGIDMITVNSELFHSVGTVFTDCFWHCCILFVDILCSQKGHDPDQLKALSVTSCYSCCYIMTVMSDLLANRHHFLILFCFYYAQVETI